MITKIKRNNGIMYFNIFLNYKNKDIVLIL